MKSFIFSHEPSEWAFGVPEELSGEPQLIDICDDFTGEPSEIARQNMPMHVNEVGHNESLKHTVHAYEKDDRTVHYYLKVDEPMRAGETIEVFVDYFEQYENVRKRKGYGLANLEGLEKSDDDFPTLLERNFSDRKEMVHIIVDLDPMELYLMIEWLETIRCELAQLMDAFIQSANELEEGSMPTCCPTAKQFVALRRFNWLSSVFQRRLDILKQAPGLDKPIAGKGIYDQCSYSISHFNYPSWGPVFEILERFPNLRDGKGVSIKNIFEQEMTEELCFGVKEKLPYPLDRSLWCAVASRLTMVLCVATAKALWQKKDPKMDDLVQIYMSEALCAAQQVRHPFDLEELSFSSDFRGDCGVDKSALPDLRRSGSIAAPQPDENLVMTGIGKACEKISTNTVEDFVAVPRPVTCLASQEHKIQENWYVFWQVIYVVDAFASKFLKDFPQEKLFSSLGVSVDHASCAIRKGIHFEEKRSIEPIQRKTKASRKANNGSTSRKGRPKTTKKSDPHRPRSSHVLFWNLIWPFLRDEMNWHLKRGTRPQDFVAFPPGVAKGLGFKPRVDYFDSSAQIINAISTNPKWSELPPVKKCVDEYLRCKSLYDKIKGSKAMPKFEKDEEKVKWLRNQVLQS